MRLPKDTDDKIYIWVYDIYTLNDILIKCQEKWGEDVCMDSLLIEPEHIQVQCFGYDQYDPSDWRDYFVVTRKGNAV
jgi:hypothetical protein